MNDKNCAWCGGELKGWSETRVGDDVTFVGSCERCGDYTVEPKLWLARETLTPKTIANIANYLATCKSLGQEVTDLEHDHVMKFFAR